MKEAQVHNERIAPRFLSKGTLLPGKAAGCQRERQVRPPAIAGLRHIFASSVAAQQRFRVSPVAAELARLGDFTRSAKLGTDFFASVLYCGAL